MASFAPTSAETLEDQRLYTRARGWSRSPAWTAWPRVGVKKNSEHHTSIQWTAEAPRALPGARAGRLGGPRRRTPPARGWSASIEAAVRDGEVPIGAEDGY